MKSVLRIRFAWLALLLSASLLTACKKEAEPAPADLATRVAGQYTFSELAYDGKTLPASQTNLKGKVDVTRQTGNTVTMALDIRLKSTNDEFMVLTADGVEVVDAGSAGVSFRYQGEQVATLNSNKLTINGEDDNNVPFRISATK
jgi:hypothetical protein